MFAGIISINLGWKGLTSEKGSGKRFSFNPSVFRLVAEGGVNFYRYYRDLGITSGPELVILSSSEQYFCKEREFKNAQTLINLKKLNLIKYLDLFLKSLVRILPPDTNFIGCFSDKGVLDSNLTGNSFSKFVFRLINFTGSVRNSRINKNEVIELLKKNNFTIVDMKEVNGLTYFISQIKRQVA
jgi:hypothetical protein